MADPYVAGSYTFASDDVCGTHTPRIKVQWGADGTVTDASTAAPLPVQLVPLATGGATIYRTIDLDESEEEVKATAGVVYSMYLYNAATAKRYVKFYNATAANVTVGTTTPGAVYVLAADQGIALSFPHGMAFSTAITFAAVTGIADNSTGAPGANEVVAVLTYV